MRTLQIGDLWLHEEQGGLSRYYYELLQNLPTVGVESRGLVLGDPKIASTTNGQVQAFARRDDSLLKRMLALRRAATAEIAALQPDLLVSHFAIYALPILEKLGRLPSVMHFHGPWAGESSVEGPRGVASQAKAWVERVVYRRGTRVIVLSNAFRQELIQGYGVAEEKVSIVPGGVDTGRFTDDLTREQARERLGWPKDRPIMLTVRRQVRRMGLENLIEAMVLIIREVPDALLILGGTGPLGADLQRLIQERGLERNVQMAGRIPDSDLSIAYQAADLTVVPTVSLEGFGLITLESLASGTPVYVTPVGGLVEVVGPFDPSCVFAGTSPAQLAATLAGSLMGRQQVPDRKTCRSYAVDNFSWPRIAEKVSGVYKNAIDQG